MNTQETTTSLTSAFDDPTISKSNQCVLIDGNEEDDSEECLDNQMDERIMNFYSDLNDSNAKHSSNNTMQIVRELGKNWKKYSVNDIFELDQQEVPNSTNYREILTQTRKRDDNFKFLLSYKVL